MNKGDTKIYQKKEALTPNMLSYRRGYKRTKIHDLCKLEAMKIQAEVFSILEGDQDAF